jgi:apolipoprotein N-acyltransferase
MRQSLILSIGGGLLLSLAWPDSGFPELLFVAFIPFLFLEKRISDKTPKRQFLRVLGYSYPGFLVFNIWTSWWIWHASDWGSVAAITITALMQAATFGGFSWIKKQIGAKRALIGLPFLWIVLEGFQHWWDLSWPWLHLGQGFATRVAWIQWYEYTGVFGGTFWVWLVNIFLFEGIRSSNTWRAMVKKVAFRLMLLVALPVFISWVIYLNYAPKGKPVEVLVVQPNLDAYTEKFDIPEPDQTQLFIQLASTAMDEGVDYVVGPETMLPWGFWESMPYDSQSMRLLQRWIDAWPNTVLVGGASTRKLYREEWNKTHTARPLQNGLFYDSFNTAFQLAYSDTNVLLYHKSQLVVGVEKLPYSKILQPLLGRFIIDLGGTTGTLGTQENREAFRHPNKDVSVGVPICYESIYGEFVAEFVKAGANLLFVITNDGWWQDSPGHRQHMHYARLRAIETRRDVARAANTGISCFINQRGDVISQIPYNQPGTIKHTMLANDAKTVYVRTGDVILRVSLMIAFLIFVAAIVQGRIKKKT